MRYQLGKTAEFSDLKKPKEIKEIGKWKGVGFIRLNPQLFGGVNCCKNGGSF
jgi:hypothetical protein